MVLYDKTSELDNVDIATMELFWYGNISMEKITPMYTMRPFSAFEVCSIPI